MRKFVVTVAAATVFLAGAPIMGLNASPMVAPGAIRAAADSLNMVERAQFIWLGRHYCWYDGGWRGPGWYWCGYESRRGLGWGGGYGWHGWHGGHAGGTISHGANRGAAVVHGGNRAAVGGGKGHGGGGHGGGGHGGGGHGGGGHGGGGHGGGGKGKH
jgi:hypothetical protein